MNLQNATVLVTGGTSGIGRGVARVLTNAGAKVAVTGRDDERLLEVARELGVPPLDVKVVPADTDRFGEGHGFNTAPSPGTPAAIAASWSAWSTSTTRVSPASRSSSMTIRNSP